MTRRFLVTGGTGFLGRSLVRALLARGESVRVLDRDTRGKVALLADVRDKLEFVLADIRDSVAVQRACAGIDVVCHLASVAGTESFYSEPATVLEVGVKGMTNVLDGCLRCGVPELLFTSSSEVYHNPPCVPTDESVSLTIPDVLNPRYSYAGGKLISELMAINYGRKHFQRVMIVRPHNIFGPGMNPEHVIPQFVERLDDARCETPAGKPVQLKIQGSGHETRSYLFIDDYTKATLAVLDRGEHLGIYHIGSEEEISTRQLAMNIATCMKLAVEINPGDIRAGSPTRRCPDTGKLLGLGFRSNTPLMVGIEKTVASLVRRRP